jgi:hypothetical protein
VVAFLDLRSYGQTCTYDTTLIHAINSHIWHRKYRRPSHTAVMSIHEMPRIRSRLPSELPRLALGFTVSLSAPGDFVRLFIGRLHGFYCAWFHRFSVLLVMSLIGHMPSQELSTPMLRIYVIPGRMAFYSPRNGYDRRGRRLPLWLNILLRSFRRTQRCATARPVSILVLTNPDYAIASCYT